MKLLRFSKDHGTFIYVSNSFYKRTFYVSRWHFYFFGTYVPSQKPLWRLEIEVRRVVHLKQETLDNVRSHHTRKRKIFTSNIQRNRDLLLQTTLYICEKKFYRINRLIPRFQYPLTRSRLTMSSVCPQIGYWGTSEDGWNVTPVYFLLCIISERSVTLVTGDRTVILPKRLNENFYSEPPFETS